MTKVELRFCLLQPLDEAMLRQIADAHSIYGIQHVRVADPEDQITVEYDASRLSPADVEAALARAGIPAALTK